MHKTTSLRHTGHHQSEHLFADETEIYFTCRHKHTLCTPIINHWHTQQTNALIACKTDSFEGRQGGICQGQKHSEYTFCLGPGGVLRNVYLWLTLPHPQDNAQNNNNNNILAPLFFLPSFSLTACVYIYCCSNRSRGNNGDGKLLEMRFNDTANSLSK